MRLLAEAEQPGSSPSLVCRRHQLPSSLFYTWRKQWRSGALTGFAAVQVVPEVAKAKDLPARAVAPVRNAERIMPATMIEAVLPGGIKLKIPADVDAAQLAMVLAALRQS